MLQTQGLEVWLDGTNGKFFIMKLCFVHKISQKYCVSWLLSGYIYFKKLTVIIKQTPHITKNLAWASANYDQLCWEHKRCLQLSLKEGTW